MPLPRNLVCLRWPSLFILFSVIHIALPSLALPSLALPSHASADQTSSSESSAPELSHSVDSDHLLIEVREVEVREVSEPRHPDRDSRDLPKPFDRRWRVYGDGRFELSPTRWLRHAEVHLGDEALSQLLRSLDGYVNLPKRQSFEGPPEEGSYAAVYLTRYWRQDEANPGNSVAIDYLEAIATDIDLGPIFQELAAIERWLSRRDQILIWVSGPSFPDICREKKRLELRLAPAPLWCEGLQPMFIDGELDEPARKRLQEGRQRLLERLRSLPRGVPQGDG